jgi:signal transduction histidine kinase
MKQNSKSSILIVDDDESVRQTLGFIFGSKGYRAEMTGTGRQALEKAQEQAFDVALLDIKLPDKEGTELLEPLKKKCPEMEMIVITGHASLGTAVKALNEGAAAYITKPLNMDDLTTKVAEVVERQCLRKENLRLYQMAQKELAERRQAQKALRHSEELIRATLDSTADDILVVNEEGQVTHANARFAQMWRVPEQLLKARDDNKLLNFVLDQLLDPQALLSKVKRLYQTAEEDSDTLLFKDGRIFERFSLPLILDEKVAGRVWSFRDVTKPRRAEEARKALMAEMEAKNAELEQFTYTVSHDLRTPLITIKGFLGLLEKHMNSGKVERIKADMKWISDAADKMELLLKKLLELSRIGRSMNPAEAIPMNELAQEAVQMVSGHLKERGVQIHIASDLPVVYGDRIRLQEVLQNLIDNSVKYMGDQHEPRIEIGVRDDGGETVLYVRDNGLGIDPKYHEKIFGLFDKLDQKTEGSGAGLAIAKKVVEVHGGRIWVESDGAHQGSTFCFSFPCESEPTDRKGCEDE